MRSPDSTVLRAIDAYNRRDLDALLAEMHPEIVLQPPLTALAGNVYRGHDGVAQWLTDLDETFERTHIEPVEVEDVGGLVLALDDLLGGGAATARVGARPVAGGCATD